MLTAMPAAQSVELREREAHFSAGE